MRNIVLALLAASGLALVGTAPAEAIGTRYPFCLQGDDSPGLSNCSFTSYQQCQATASGSCNAWKIPITSPAASLDSIRAAAAPGRAIPITERDGKSRRDGRRASRVNVIDARLRLFVKRDQRWNGRSRVRAII